MRIAVGASSGGQTDWIAATMSPLLAGTGASTEDATSAGVGCGVSTGAATTAALTMVVTAEASSVGSGVAVGEGATKAGAARRRSSSIGPADASASVTGVALRTNAPTPLAMLTTSA